VSSVHPHCTIIQLILYLPAPHTYDTFLLGKFPICFGHTVPVATTVYVRSSYSTALGRSAM